MVNIQKAAVIGCGFVGSTIAYTLMQQGTFSELVLIDAVQAKGEGEAMDISHGIPFAHSMDIHAGTYEDIADASVVIITAGANQKPGETRLDLVQKNSRIMKGIIAEIKRVKCEGILMIVSNPVDILTEVALRESGFPKERVIGSGTVLDTARFKYLISQKLDVDSRNVHAFIAGEHGDSELAVWSCANVYGIPLDEFARIRGIRQPGPGQKTRSTTRCVTALTRSSSARGRPTTASGWRRQGSRRRSCGTATRLRRSPYH